MSSEQIRKVDTNEMLVGIQKFLHGLGVDLNDQHLIRTPDRVVKAWAEEFASGYSQDPKKILSVEFVEDCDEMIIVKDIPFTSHCSHHLVQFSGTCKIGYVPKKKITGLSKLARVLDVYAKRLQVQERLTRQVAEAIQKYLIPLGTGVVISAVHSCMVCRGVQKPGSVTITSCLLGKMRTDKAMRQEFLNF
jgi:GTP cyclohydrolase I